MWQRLSRYNVHVHSPDIDARGWQHDCIAHVSTARPHGVMVTLGRVEGADPYATLLAVAHQFTPLDAELIEQHTTYIERQVDEIARIARAHDALCVEIVALTSVLHHG